MEIRQLEYFVLISEEKSFIKAAKKTYISQQALSKSMQNLERELSLPLLVRSNQGIQLTAYGEIFLRKSRDILEDIDDLKRELNERKNHVDVLKVGITEGMSRKFLDIIWEFQNNYPKIAVSLVEAPDKTIERNILENKLDIGVLGSMGNSDDIEYHFFTKGKTFLAVSKNNPLSQRKKVRLKELANETFVIGPEEHNAHYRLEKVCREHGFVPHIGYQSADINFLKEIVSRNKGIFTCPEDGLEYLKRSDIKILRIDEELDIFDRYLIVRKGRKLSRSIKKLMDFLINYYESKNLSIKSQTLSNH